VELGVERGLLAGAHGARSPAERRNRRVDSRRCGGSSTSVTVSGRDSWPPRFVVDDHRCRPRTGRAVASRLDSKVALPPGPVRSLRYSRRDTPARRATGSSSTAG